MRWSHFFGQFAKVCSNAKMRHEHGQKGASFHGGVQEARSAGGATGARHSVGDRVALRSASESGKRVEAASSGESRRSIFRTRAEAWRGARSDDSGSACQDRRVNRGAGFFSARIGALSRPERVRMIDRDSELSLSRQCELLDVSRPSQYHPSAGESAENLALMRRLDELRLERPFYGSREMTRDLRREGIVTGPAA